ncbi:MAG: PqqD family protein [Lachnospiraceae bacterium]|nr:PqqD family protein [Lachnospiraceae bacterium]
MNNLNSGKKYCINPEYVFREIAGETVIVSVSENCLLTNTVITPNETASFIFKAFQTPHTKEDVVRAGLEEYDVDEETIVRVVEGFVQESLKLKVLVEAD